MKPPAPPRTPEEAAHYVTRLLETLQEQDYAFTVEAVGDKWDVYRRRDWQGVEHTIAFRMENGNVIVGVVVPFRIIRAKGYRATRARCTIRRRRTYGYTRPRAGRRKEAGAGLSAHRWSGWPGAWCLDCGAEDQMELCLADHSISLLCVEGHVMCEEDHEPLRCDVHVNGPCPCPGEGRADPYLLNEKRRELLFVLGARHLDRFCLEFSGVAYESRCVNCGGPWADGEPPICGPCHDDALKSGAFL